MTKSAKLLRELIALPSVNPAFLPAGHPLAGEHRVGDFLASSAAKVGLDVEFQQVLPQRRNLVARLTPPAGARHRVILAPHLDTVNGNEAQFKPRAHNGRLYGRGACDTKGSVAAMFTALTGLARSGSRAKTTEILFVGLVDEENAQSGSRAFGAGGIGGDLAIVGEPSREKVVTAHKGSVWLRVDVQGRAAHGAQPDEGVNAVHSMARIVDFLETEYADFLTRRTHEFLGAATVSVGTIHGGTQPNIVPDQCTITVDRRTLPGETEHSVVGEVAELLKRKGLGGQVSSCKVSECLPLETDPGLPLVRSFLRAARQRRPLGATYFCDASILAQAGIPSVVFGPGDIAQAHTADEWISLASLERATTILMQFLRELP